MSKADFRYEELPGSFYDDHTNPAKYGRFAAWYHSTRYARLAATVAEYARHGDLVLDVACGSAVWNSARLAVLGLDINASMLRQGLTNGRLVAGIVSDLARAGLANNSMDLIVSSEVLEHIHEKGDVVAEYFRLLKPGGRLVLTVPFDRPGTPFFLLFNAQCLYQGWIRGDTYYRAFCGHVNHFSPRAVKRLLCSSGFLVERQFLHHYFLIYTVAAKPL